MKRVLLWAVRWIVRLVLLAAILIVLGVTVLPRWVEREAVAKLQDAGFREAGLRVRHLGLGSSSLSDLSLGEGERFRIGHLDLAYEARRLLEAEVGTIEISDLHWKVAIRDGKLDWRPFSKIEGGEGSKRIPFERLLLHSATVDVDWEGHLLRCHARGSVEKRSATEVAVDLEAEVAGVSLKVEGRVEIAALDVDLALAGEITDLATLVAALPAQLVPPGHAGGKIGLQGRLHGDADQLSLELRARGEDLSWAGTFLGRQLVLEGASLEVTTARGELVDGDGLLRALAVQTDVPALHIAGTPPLSLKGNARHDADEGSLLHLDLREPRDGGLTLSVEATAPSARPESPPEALTVVIDMDATVAFLRSLVPAAAEAPLEVSPEARLTGSLDLRLDTKAGDLADVAVAGRGTLGLSAAELRFPGAGGRLQGARAALDVHGSWQRDHASVVIAAGSRIEARSLRLRHPESPWEIRAPGPDAAALELRQDMGLAFSALAERPEWSLEAEDLAAEVTGVNLHSEGARIEAVDLAVHGALRQDQGRWSFDAGQGSSLRVWGPISPVPDIALRRAHEAQPLFELGIDATARMHLARGETLDWKVAAPELRLRGAGTALLPQAPEALENLAIDGRLGLEASPAGAEVVVRSDVSLSWGALSLDAGAATGSVSAGQLSLRATSGERLLSWTAGEEPYPLRGHLELASPTALHASVPHGASVTISDLALRARLAGGAGGWELQSELEAALLPSLAELGGEIPEIDWSGVIDLRATLSGGDDPSLPAAEPWELALQAKTRPQQQAILTSWEGGEAAIGSLEVRARGQLHRDRPPVVTGEITLAEAGLYHDPAALSMSDVSAAVPFAFGTPLSDPGRLDAETIWLGDDLLPGITGSLALDAGRLDLTLAWPLFENVVARGSGSLRPFDRIPEGRFALDLPRFELGPGTQPGDLITALDGLTLGGHVALQADIGIDGPRITPEMKIALDQVSLESETWKASATGIDAAITLDGLVPMTTPGNQVLSIESGTLGKLRVRDGRVAFRLEGPRSLLIEQTSWGWAGGYLYLHAARIDPRNPVLDGAIYADHLKLGDLLDLLAPGQATGEGTLYGRLPVTIRWPKIEYGTAFLYAEPGLGHVSIIDPGGVLGRLPDQARGALRDFEYSVLKLRFVDGKDATLRLRGHSRDPAYPREVILDININGFKELLDEAIKVDRSSKGLFGR